MVEFAPVMPPELYPVYDTGSYHLVQAHTIIRNRHIRKWFASRARMGHTVILDNGTIELGAPDVKSLFWIARAIRPTIIICPDVYCEADKTLAMFKRYLEVCAGYAPGVMMVPHGDSIDQWVECTSRMYHHVWQVKPSAEIYLGVPKVLDSLMPNGRLAALVELQRAGYTVTPSTTHLLGVWDYLVELQPLIAVYPDLMGLDTTLPVARAFAPVGEDTGKCVLRGEHWNTTEDQIEWPQHQRIKNNILQVRLMLNQWSRDAIAPTALTEIGPQLKGTDRPLKTHEP